jgi:hypothetical protein
MVGTRLWWLRQGVLVVTAVTALTLLIRSVFGVLAGDLVTGLLFGGVGVAIALTGGYVWYRSGSTERVQLLEKQIYGPK